MTTKQKPAQKAFRLSDDAREILATLAARLGVTEVAVVELALRDKAKAEGVWGTSADGEKVAA